MGFMIEGTLRNPLDATLPSMVGNENREVARLEFEPDPVIEAFKQGIDRTLLRENLKKSPHDRLVNLVALQRFAEELRRAGRKARIVQ